MEFLNGDEDVLINAEEGADLMFDAVILGISWFVIMAMWMIR